MQSLTDESCHVVMTDRVHRAEQERHPPAAQGLPGALPLRRQGPGPQHRPARVQGRAHRYTAAPTGHLNVLRCYVLRCAEC